jgi:signal transduction histidine kinase
LDHAFWEFLVSPALLLVLIGGLGFYYMRLSAKIMSRLANSNHQLNELRHSLEEKIAEKTLALEDKNLQLERFNSSLKERVLEEIEKNTQQEQHILQQSRLAQLGEMISMIAHQWRQPLAAIASAVLDLKVKLSLRSFDLTTPEGENEHFSYLDGTLQNIENHVLVLTNTIDDFRDFYKADKRANKLPIQRPIEKAVNVMKSTCADESITIIQEYRATRTISMYDGELMQVFLSILKNAQDNFIQKVTPNPIIIITTYHTQNNGVGVTICDNGGGIPLDIIDNIFDPYFSTKQNLNGTGLGLYLSKTIIEEHHNGVLLAYNTQNGVCFKIELEGIR